MNARTDIQPKTSQKFGFTIIEVVLVLAIAALIFLMVFIALPALQRGQRDTARKNDATAVASALGTFRSNNNGRMPTIAGDVNDRLSFASFRTTYIDGLSQYGTSEDDVKPVSDKSSDSELTDSVMEVVIGKNCKDASSSRAAAVWVKLESGNGAVVCTDA